MVTCLLRRPAWGFFPPFILEKSYSFLVVRISHKFRSLFELLFRIHLTGFPNLQDFLFEPFHLFLPVDWKNPVHVVGVRTSRLNIANRKSLGQFLTFGIICYFYSDLKSFLVFLFPGFSQKSFLNAMSDSTAFAVVLFYDPYCIAPFHGCFFMIVTPVQAVRPFPFLED